MVDIPSYLRLVLSVTAERVHTKQASKGWIYYSAGAGECLETIGAPLWMESMV